MNLLNILVKALVLWLVVTTSSWANIDYQCLNACVHDGKSNSVCMTDCNYATPVAPALNSLDKPLLLQSEHDLGWRPHNKNQIVKAPTALYEGQIELVKPKPYIDSVHKDYLCMSNCLQQTKSYGMCEKQCTPSVLDVKKTGK